MNTVPPRESGLEDGPSGRGTRGRLHVYLGAAPGVGKTYAMLDEGLRLTEDDLDVLVGVVETHDRQDLLSKVGGLEVVPPRQASYRGVSLKEMDLDALLARRPAVVLVDDAVGSPVPQRPEEAQFTVELADRRLLAMTGSRLTEEDAELLQVLLAEMRQTRERAQLERFSPESWHAVLHAVGLGQERRSPSAHLRWSPAGRIRQR